MLDQQTTELIYAKQRRLHELEVIQAKHGPSTPPEYAAEIKQLRQELASYSRNQQILSYDDPTLEAPPHAHELILLISPKGNYQLTELSPYYAIQFHRPTLQRCWLLATEQSLETANLLEHYLSDYGITFNLHLISNPATMQDTFELTKTILQRIKSEDPSRVIVADFTGGSKPMTAGLAFACAGQIHLQYLMHQKNRPSKAVLQKVDFIEEANAHP
jgi:hypothetical protein